MAGTAKEATTPSEVMRAHAPLRTLYRREPEQAISHKRARTSGTSKAPWKGQVEILGDGYATSWEFGTDRKVGGPQNAPNPPEIMCASIASCEHVTIQMVADLMGIDLERLEVEVTGEVDVRGTLMISEEAPVGFSSMRCEVTLECAPGTDEKRRALLLEYAERSCVTLATIREGFDLECTVAAA